MYVLGIESSCDETAAAVVDDTGLVLSDVVRSQIALHAPYGGVVPELASRDHMRSIIAVVREALTQSQKGWRDLAAIAATSRPGLSGALLVGLQAAKGLAWGADLPFVAVDHLVGHLLAVFLRRPKAPPPPPYPFIALLASGGHTAIYRVGGSAAEAIEELGATRDDAAGEAFDKIAKVLGLGYPGGPVIDRLASQGDPTKFPFVAPMAQRTSLEFSFSGLKTAVVRRFQLEGMPRNDQELADACAGFQSAVVGTLVTKTVRAAQIHGVSHVVLCGGVAANRELRARAQKACDEAGLVLAVPPVPSCTDNAAMIAYAGLERFRSGHSDSLSTPPCTHTCLARATQKGGGKRLAGASRRAG